MRVECLEEHTREYTCIVDRHELQRLLRDAAAKEAGVNLDDLGKPDWDWDVEFEDVKEYGVGIRAKVRLIQSLPTASVTAEG